MLKNGGRREKKVLFLKIIVFVASFLFFLVGGRGFGKRRVECAKGRGKVIRVKKWREVKEKKGKGVDPMVTHI